MDRKEITKDEADHAWTAIQVILKDVAKYWIRAVPGICLKFITLRAISIRKVTKI